MVYDPANVQQILNVVDHVYWPQVRLLLDSSVVLVEGDRHASGIVDTDSRTFVCLLLTSCELKILVFVEAVVVAVVLQMPIKRYYDGYPIFQLYLLF